MAFATMTRMMRASAYALATMLATLSLAAMMAAHAKADTDWSVYNGGAGGEHFSLLTQIDRRNVASLQRAWTFNLQESGDSETNPLVVGRVLYGYTPGLKIFALDAATGQQLWLFDADMKVLGPSRGLAYWSDGKQARLLAGIMNRLYALDPKTGQPIPEFGSGGFVDLRADLGRPLEESFVALTTPGVVYKDLLIVGFRTTETQPAPPGDIRAFDVRTGRLRWSFHTIPRPGEPGYTDWPKDAWKTAGGANVWAGFALDEKRGIVYAPTGSAASDMYGADRRGNNLYANTLLALDANTGKRLWHFQGVHHDIWDRDFSAPPTLVTVIRNGRKVDAVAQATKQGYLYLFDRVNGKPLFPIRERPVPSSNVMGEQAARTQPVPVLPAPYARQALTEDMLTRRTPVAHEWAVQQFRLMRNEGMFTPFAVDQQTLIFPGFDGGAEWGGTAVDPRSGVLYINSNDIAWTGGLKPAVMTKGRGATLYVRNCTFCHSDDRKGNEPAFPSLLDLKDRLTAEQIVEVIRSGRGRMPPFNTMSAPDLQALAHYVLTGEDVGLSSTVESQPDASSKREMEANLWNADTRLPYRFTGYRKFYDPDGYPAVEPPWGTLNAIDLNTGKYLWKIPLGEYPRLVEQGHANTGSENYGGPILTASNLLFIGATIYDKKIRAYDSETGQLLWQDTLPYSGTATPATYMVDGRQYVVISTNNARDRSAPQGAAYVAYRLQ